MNNPVNFETAKLLKEKGFDIRVKPFYNGLKNNELIISDIIGTDNNLPDWYPAPTITEIVMWLYERHGIWIISDWSQAKWCYSIIDIKEETIRKVSGEKWSERSSGVYLNTGLDFKSPTEAYEAAIIYTLKNLL